MGDFSFLGAIQLAWILAAGVWFVKRKDELPLVISGFLFYVFGFRWWVISQGLSTPVDISPFGFDPMTEAEAMSALSLGVLGESVLLGIYFWRQKISLEGLTPILTASQGVYLRNLLIRLVIICMPLVFLTRGYITSQTDIGKVVAFEVSNYAYLFPLVMSGLAILVAAVWKAGQIQSAGDKFMAGALLLVIAKLTFAPSMRFQFIGLLLAATFIFTAGLRLDRRLAILAIGGGITAVAFALAGALRSEDVMETGLKKGAQERFAFAEDANMLDGFALLRQVYPERLPYSLGKEHVDIFLRPIPRSLWPDKPVGGYLNKLGLTGVATGGTLGISPSLLGSFYQEGGVIGILLFASLYGWGLARLVMFSAIRLQPFAGSLVRGILCAFLIPLLRGGDLPGIYAWCGMSFWPCFLVLWTRRKEWVRPLRVLKRGERFARRTTRQLSSAK